VLRAERMSDCIFNGTAKRPPMAVGGDAHAGRSGIGRSAKFGSEAALTRCLWCLSQCPIALTALRKKLLTQKPENTVDGGGNRTRLSGGTTREYQDGSKFLKRTPAEKPGMHRSPAKWCLGAPLVSARTERVPHQWPRREVARHQISSWASDWVRTPTPLSSRDASGKFHSKPTEPARHHRKAAGITKFKTKRRLADAKSNVEAQPFPHNDIYVEWRSSSHRQTASLESARYAEIREQMRAQWPSIGE